MVKGSGGFGTVYKTTRKSDNRPTVIKVIRTTNEEEANLALNEAIMMHQLPHPNIL